MFVKDIYTNLAAASLGAKVYPIIVPEDVSEDCIVYALESTEFNTDFNNESNFYQANVSFICVSKTALGSINLGQTLENHLKNFSGELVSGGSYVQSTDFQDIATIYDDQAKVFGLSMSVQFTYNK